MHINFLGLQLVILGLFHSVVILADQQSDPILNNLSVNGSINIHQLVSNSNETPKVQKNSFIEAVLNIHQEVNISYVQQKFNKLYPTLDYEVSLNDIPKLDPQSSSLSSSISKVRLLTNSLLTYSGFTGSIGIMGAFCSNQKKYNKIFADEKICTGFSSAIVFGYTTCLSYLTYLDIDMVSSLFKILTFPVRLLFKLIIFKYNEGVKDQILVNQIPQYHWQNYSLVLNEFTKIGITINAISYEYGILGNDNVPYFFKPSYNITLGDDHGIKYN